MRFHWFLPTNGGDGRQVVGGGHGVGAGPSGRPASVSYLGQIARAAEDVGFEAALTPTGAWCDDAWLSTAMVSQVSERLKFLVAFRPGLTAFPEQKVSDILLVAQVEHAAPCRRVADTF